MAFFLIFGSAAVGFLAMSLSTLVHLRWLQRLPSLESLIAAGHVKSAEQKPVRCSAVIAARDEELRIEQTVRRMLGRFPVLLYAMLNSVFVTLRRGGICWRETFYALELLRKGTLR